MAKLQDGTRIYGAANVDSQINVGTFGAANGVLISNSSILVGNSSVNSVISGVSVKLHANSTSNATITAPTPTQISGGNYFLNANSSWTVARPVLNGFQPHKSNIPVAGVLGQNTLQLDPIDIPAELQFDRVVFPVNFTFTTNSPGTLSLTMDYVAYTKNISTLSQQYGTRFTTQYTYSGTNSGDVLGPRNITFAWTTTFEPGEYVFGIRSSTATGGAACVLSNFLASQIASSYSGVLGVATNASVQRTLGLGQFSVTTASAPSSVAFSALRGVSSAFIRPQIFYLTSGTA